MTSATDWSRAAAVELTTEEIELLTGDDHNVSHSRAVYSSVFIAGRLINAVLRKDNYLGKKICAGGRTNAARRRTDRTTHIGLDTSHGGSLFR